MQSWMPSSLASNWNDPTAILLLLLPCTGLEQQFRRPMRSILFAPPRTHSPAQSCKPAQPHQAQLISQSSPTTHISPATLLLLHYLAASPVSR